MTCARQHHRLLPVAFVAILGILSMAGDAKASSLGNAPRKGVRECCLKRACHRLLLRADEGDLAGNACPAGIVHCLRAERA